MLPPTTESEMLESSFSHTLVATSNRGSSHPNSASYMGSVCGMVLVIVDFSVDQTEELMTAEKARAHYAMFRDSWNAVPRSAGPLYIGGARRNRHGYLVSKVPHDRPKVDVG